MPSSRIGFPIPGTRQVLVSHHCHQSRPTVSSATVGLLSLYRFHLSSLPPRGSTSRRHLPVRAKDGVRPSYSVLSTRAATCDTQCRHRQRYPVRNTNTHRVRAVQQDCAAGRGRARAHPCPLRIPSWKVERRSTAVGCKFGVWYGWRTGPRKPRSPSSRSRNSQHMSCRCGRGRAPRQLLRTSAHHRALCSDGCALQTRQRGLMPQRARKARENTRTRNDRRTPNGCADAGRVAILDQLESLLASVWVDSLPLATSEKAQGL